MLENISLKSRNTFGIDAKAEKLFILKNESDLPALRNEFGEKRPFVLGGGSNILFTRDVQEPILAIETQGIRTIDQGETVEVWSQAGENWHQFVRFCVERDWGGLENLSLIPGQVGTAPVQNIGAYGVELKDVCIGLRAFHWMSGSWHTFNAEQCNFGYRHSMFKAEAKDQYIITEVGFRLQKHHHQLHTEYGDIEQELEKLGKTNFGIQDISEAVISIRQGKLPDPEVLGNAGSFFKNPLVDLDHAQTLQKLYFNLRTFPQIDNPEKVKLPAAWLIEQAGWKGYRRGNCGVHVKQALVLVNYGNAKGADMLKLAKDIQYDVFQKFGVQLEMEVNVY